MDVEKQIHDITISYMSATNAHKKSNNTNKTPKEYTENYIYVYGEVSKFLQSNDFKSK